MYDVPFYRMSNYQIKSGSLNEYEFNSSHVNSSRIFRKEEKSAVLLNYNIKYEGLFFEVPFYSKLIHFVVQQMNSICNSCCLFHVIFIKFYNFSVFSCSVHIYFEVELPLFGDVFYSNIFKIHYLSRVLLDKILKDI